MDWHLNWYVEDDAEKHARGRNPKLYRGPAGDWRLTTAEKKRILLNNIYGVDIDPQAVEVTKLSLLLKVLGGRVGRDAGQPVADVSRAGTARPGRQHQVRQLADRSGLLQRPPD